MPVTSSDPIINALDAEGALEAGDLVIEAVTVYAYVRPDDAPGDTHYGWVIAGGSMPTHHLRGLLETALERIDP